MKPITSPPHPAAAAARTSPPSPTPQNGRSWLAQGNFLLESLSAQISKSALSPRQGLRKVWSTSDLQGLNAQAKKLTEEAESAAGLSKEYDTLEAMLQEADAKYGQLKTDLNNSSTSEQQLQTHLDEKEREVNEIKEQLETLKAQHEENSRHGKAREAKFKEENCNLSEQRDEACRVANAWVDRAKHWESTANALQDKCQSLEEENENMRTQLAKADAGVQEITGLALPAGAEAVAAKEVAALQRQLEAAKRANGLYINRLLEMQQEKKNLTGDLQLTRRDLGTMAESANAMAMSVMSRNQRAPAE